jgi:hypothetical protein
MLRYFMGRQFAQSRCIELDAPGVRSYKSHDGFQRRGFSRTVAPHQTDDLAGRDGERDAT